MYLSRLILNPRHRAVQRDLANCHELHRTVMSGFPNVAANGDARAQLRVLYRLDTDTRTGQPTLLVQSAIRPSWDHLADGYLLTTGFPNPDCKPIGPIYDRLRNNMTLAFRLRANPTKRVSEHAPNVRPDQIGKRVELRSEQEQLDWLARKGESCGFRLRAVRTTASPTTPQPPRQRERAAAIFGQEAPQQVVVPDIRTVPGGKIIGRQPQGRRMTFAAVTFEGVLEITDVDRFRAALVEGIGPAKAYGFGLLSIAPPPRNFE